MILIVSQTTITSESTEKQESVLLGNQNVPLKRKIHTTQELYTIWLQHNPTIHSKASKCEID